MVLRPDICDWVLGPHAVNANVTNRVTGSLFICYLWGQSFDQIVLDGRMLIFKGLEESHSHRSRRRNTVRDWPRTLRGYRRTSVHDRLPAVPSRALTAESGHLVLWRLETADAILRESL